MKSISWEPSGLTTKDYRLTTTYETVTTLPGQLETTDHLSHDQRESIIEQGKMTDLIQKEGSNPIRCFQGALTRSLCLSNLAKIPIAAACFAHLIA